MHELGTIYYVMKTVENLAAENKLTKVGSITLEVERRTTCSGIPS